MAYHLNPDLTALAAQQFSVFDPFASKIAEDTKDYLAVTSLGIDPTLVPLHRYVPVGLYAGGHHEDHVYTEIVVALIALLEVAGFRQVGLDVWQSGGSMRWWPIVRSKQKLTQEDLYTRLDAIAGALAKELEARKVPVEVEIAQAKAKARKDNAEAVRAYSEAAVNFAKVLMRASLAFSLIIGTVHVTRPTSSPNDTVRVVKLDPKSAYDVWQKIPRLTSVNLGNTESFVEPSNPSTSPGEEEPE